MPNRVGSGYHRHSARNNPAYHPVALVRAPIAVHGCTWPVHLIPNPLHGTTQQPYVDNHSHELVHAGINKR